MRYAVLLLAVAVAGCRPPVPPGPVESRREALTLDLEGTLRGVSEESA